MGPLAIPLALLATLYTGKEIADMVAKIKGHKGGLEEWIGATESEGETRQRELLAKRGRAKGAARMARADEIQGLQDRVDAFINRRGGPDMFAAEQAMSAHSRGSRIEDILPPGIRPGRVLSLLQLNEVEAWRKHRDAAPSDAPIMQAAREGAAAPPPQGRLMQLAQGAGMVPGQGAQPGQQGAQPGQQGMVPRR